MTGIKVGITGGIGSGKSTICKIFQLLRVPVYYADIEAKKILEEDTFIKAEVKKIFGNEVCNKNGEIDRKKLAAVVFNNKIKLEQLNSIIHPAVKNHFAEWLKRQTAFPYIIKEAAILFESGAYKELDLVITVTSPSELRIKRVMQRDGVSRATVEQRMQQQMSDEEKIKLSQFVIVNNEQELVIPHVLKIHQELVQRSGFCVESVVPSL